MKPGNTRRVPTPVSVYYERTKAMQQSTPKAKSLFNIVCSTILHIVMSIFTIPQKKEPSAKN